MNSNETLGFGRDSMSAIRIWRELYQPAWPVGRIRSAVIGCAADRLLSAALDSHFRTTRCPLWAEFLLPQDPRVPDAAGYALRIEMLEQRQHGTPARAHSIAQLRHCDRAIARDDFTHHRDGRCVGVLRERDVVADPDDVSSLRQRADDLCACSALAGRLRER